MGKAPEVLLSEQEPSAKFLPAFFVDVVELGQEFQSGELPLHMTYFPPLQAGVSPEHVRNMRRLINPLPSFTATVGESDYFGDENTIHVKRVEHSPRLLAVHRRLVAAIGYLTHDAQYRTPYNPHITMSEEDTRLQTGDTFEVAGFSLVEKQPLRNTWMVMAKIGLRGEIEV